MTTLLALIPFLKPLIKQVFDAAVVPEITKLIAQIPGADVDAMLVAVQAAVDAEVDKLLS